MKVATSGTEYDVLESAKELFKKKLIVNVLVEMDKGEWMKAEGLTGDQVPKKSVQKQEGVSLVVHLWIQLQVSRFKG